MEFPCLLVESVVPILENIVRSMKSTQFGFILVPLVARVGHLLTPFRWPPTYTSNWNNGAISVSDNFFRRTHFGIQKLSRYFKNFNLDKSNFKTSNLEKSKFQKIKFKKIDFKKIKFWKFDLKKLNLKKSNF